MFKLVVVGILVHLLLVYFVFDIYFTSPIHHGMTPHKSGGLPPARRLVLLVADGLRSESLYDSHMLTRAPYLHSIKNGGGMWGVSHTRVPTESRPGHVAILAGFGEDPSAITKGWKYNPVDFDSVINQSTNAWCWGSPDIVDIFNRDQLEHIHLHSYDAYMQDFSGKESPMILDTWVFDRVEQFVINQKRKRPCTDFCEPGNIFFLHLLGLDTAGHSIKPTSEKYLENIKIVDSGVKKMVNLFENYFHDSQTVYIFTSDHGMTNWGSHGDGSEHETSVPFLAWGSGIEKSLVQQDLLQIDIAPLISSLIGINIPINSMGVVPVNFLQTSFKQKARIMQSNALQISEQFISKNLDMQHNTIAWSLIPFLLLTEETMNKKQNDLNNFIANGSYSNAILLSEELIKLCKEGLNYYQQYYQKILLIFLTIGFMGWIIFLFTSISKLGTLTYQSSESAVIRSYRIHPRTIFPYVFYGFSVVMILLIFVQPISWNYFIYCTFPFITWCMVVKYRQKCFTMLRVLATYKHYNLFLIGLFYFFGIEILIFTFFERTFLSLIYVYFTCRAMFKESDGLFSTWTIGQISMALCPIYLEIQTKFSYFYHITGLLLWILFGHRILSTPKSEGNKQILFFQLVMVAVAYVNCLMVHITMVNNFGLLLINQAISWILLLIFWIPPLLMRYNPDCKLLSAMISLVIPYTLMSVGYESIFIFLFSQHMLNWVFIESDAKYANKVILLRCRREFKKYSDENSVRRCFYCLTFVMTGYFGLGNTGSMNSFDPMWVRCFVTVFSPFTMTALIFIKLIIPFLLVMCAFSHIMVITAAQIRNSFLTILLFCDLMVIQFLHFIRNEGSWLEIGMSLSRFIAVNVTTIVLLLLYQIAHFLTTSDFGIQIMKFKNICCDYYTA